MGRNLLRGDYARLLIFAFSPDPPEEHSRLGAACEEADREIDRIVYALYGLTEGEIAVLEGATHERPRPYQGCAQQPYRIEVILAKNRHVKKHDPLPTQPFNRQPGGKALS